MGVASEKELVESLTTLSPPPPPITLTNINIHQDVGCFVGGAGELFYFPGSSSKLLHVDRYCEGNSVFIYS